MNEITKSTLPLATFSDIQQMGAELAKSRMFGVSNPSQGVALLVTSVQTGMSVFDINRKYHILTDGKMTMKADAMLAEYKKLGGKCKWVKFDDTEARAVWSHGENVDLELSFTIDQARDAGLIRKGSAWDKHPAAMLRARLISTAIRMICPEVNHGVYDASELPESESVEPVDVTPPRRMETPAPATKRESETPAPDQPEDAEEVEATPFDAVDFSVCPISKNAGTPWDSMDAERLKRIYELTPRPAGMLQGHYDYIAGLIGG